MKYLIVINYLLLSFTMIPASQAEEYRRISGQIDGVLPKACYIVNGNLQVAQGKTLTLTPGTKIYFEPFTGIIVHGRLIAIGEEGIGIVFSSVKDGAIRGAVPAEFDWNGIEIAGDASYSRFSNAAVCFASIGLNIRSNKTPVTLVNVSLNRNGYAGILRDGSVVASGENISVNHDWQPDNPDSRKKKKSRLESDGPVKNKHQDRVKKSKGKTVITGVRIGTGVIALCGTGLWLGGHLGAEHYNRKYAKSANTEEVDYYREKRQNSVIIRNIGIVNAISGATGLGITFFF